MLVWPKKDFFLFLLFSYSLKKDYKERPNYVSLLVSYNIKINDYLSWYIKIIPWLLICNDLLYFTIFLLASKYCWDTSIPITGSILGYITNWTLTLPLCFTKLFWPTGYLQGKSAYSYLFYFYIFFQESVKWWLLVSFRAIVITTLKWIHCSMFKFLFYKSVMS